jgi:putative ABC transport system permease protein
MMPGAMSSVGFDIIYETFLLGLKNLRLHLLRSFLTALGIIFGVAAVICMLSISEGASADEMRMIRLLGTQNIIINSIRPTASRQASQEQTAVINYGVTDEDRELIETTIPHVNKVIPLKEVAFGVEYRDQRGDWKVIGTTPDFFKIVNIDVAAGRLLSDLDMQDLKPVCVIGAEVATELFQFEDPIGRSVWAASHDGKRPYMVVGVLKSVATAGAPARGVEERNLNREVYIPFATGKKLYGDVVRKVSSGSEERFEVDLSSLYVNATTLDHVEPLSQMIARVFERNHEDQDYEIKVPLARLKLAEKKKRNQQMLLGFIAGISLVVGGIGIMNIMLATVTERTREIGIRRALGARQRHIQIQFLVETVVLTMCAGSVGVLLGYISARLINALAQWETIVEPWTMVVSFSLSALVGIFFGMYPAMKAAKLDPIEALRHE